MPDLQYVYEVTVQLTYTTMVRLPVQDHHMAMAVAIDEENPDYDAPVITHCLYKGTVEED